MTFCQTCLRKLSPHPKATILTFSEQTLLREVHTKFKDAVLTLHLQRPVPQAITILKHLLALSSRHHPTMLFHVLAERLIAFAASNCELLIAD
jgi:hypothetical protein